MERLFKIVVALWVVTIGPLVIYGLIQVYRLILSGEGC